MAKPRTLPITGWTPQHHQVRSSSGTTASATRKSLPLSPSLSPWSGSSPRNKKAPQQQKQQQQQRRYQYRRDDDDDDPRKPSTMNDDNVNEMDEEDYEDAPINQGLISKRRKPLDIVTQHYQQHQYEWLRPYWLGGSLCLILFAFWLLDSLKDPIFARLVDGQISSHQPPAKLVSVASTLLLVCLLEYWTNKRQEQRQQQVLEQYEQASVPSSHETILDPGGIWKRMPITLTSSPLLSPTPEHALDDTISVAMFFQIGIPYTVVFLVIAFFVWKFEQSELPMDGERTSPSWYVLGYVMYAAIESFGSLSVATFWSYTNSTLSLPDAERYYGPIIATAQLGAIGGSTLVASGRWEAPYLLVVVAFSIILHLILMHLYDRKFEPTSVLAVDAAITTTAAAAATGVSPSGSLAGATGEGATDDSHSVVTWQDNNATLTKPFWSGLYLIFQNDYVILILAVSCLYEVCMTLLDYQMKLLGYAKFDQLPSGTSITPTTTPTMSFSEFMGRYGQMVNVISLLFSSLLFPWLIRRMGLRRTLMVFPTTLLLVTFLVYGAVPGNLTVLFFSLSLLKAMTYSIHDPSKELLYIPTSNAVKFRAKFWIDVVGERILKAIGSAFNTLADTVQRSIEIGSIPSFFSALGLWMACYYVGVYFDKLLATGKMIGLEYSIDPSMYYSRIPHHDRDFADHGHGGCSEVEIYLDETGEEEAGNISALDLMADPVQHDASQRNDALPLQRKESTSADRIELPSLTRR